VALSTEEGAFLRGQVRMEEKIELQFEPEAEPTNLMVESPQSNQPNETD
jgi:hypothetical protein